MKALTAHVLVFDSGVGGLSIVEHIRARLGAASVTYLADSLFFPYGTMTDAALVERVLQLLTEAVARWQPDLVVVACNSASTLALPSLRRHLTIPIVGVVPAIKPAAQLTTSGVIGLLATPGTINRHYTDELIRDFAPGCRVIRIGTSQLVQVVEDVVRGNPPAPALFQDILAPLRDDPDGQRLDTMVLACTHFPLVREQLAAAAPGVSHWIDSGDAIARRVEQLLRDLPPSTATLHRGHNAHITGTEEPGPALLETYAGFGFTAIDHF